MAGEVIRQLSEELKCAICLNIYTDPKLLQCFHVYCRKCLEKQVVRDQQGEFSLVNCPICLQATPIPANGVAGLQSAFQTNEILQVRDNLIKQEDIVSSLEGSKVDATPLTSSSDIAIFNCLEHKDKERELYCETCGDLICLKCGIKGGLHEGHDYDNLKNAYERYKEEVRPSLESMEGKLDAVNKTLAQLGTHHQEVSDQQAAIEVSIHEKIRQLHEFLDIRKTELINQLHHLTRGKLKGLEIQKDELETIQVQLRSCHDFVRNSMNTESQAEVLRMKKNTMKQMKNMTTLFQPYMLNPNAEADIAFISSLDIITACHNFGEIYAAGKPDPSLCQAIGDGLSVAVVGKKSSAIVEVFDCCSEKYSHPVNSLECELVSKITGARVRGRVERRGQNQYEIEYQPTIKGRHSLHIKVEGQHIKGSPFSVAVKLPFEKLGNPILTIDRVKGPWGMAVNQRGEVVISENDGHCVSVFCQRGKKLRSFGTQGSGHGHFNGPRGVAVDGEGNILVADTENHCIQKFTITGEFLGAVGTKGSGPRQFNCPCDVSFNSNNNKVYVTDSWNDRVQVLNSDLTFFKTFGKEGIGKERFTHPWGIACDSTGKVYVIDSVNHRIQVFKADGKFVGMFGSHGEGMGEQHRPVGITIDSNDVVYVSEFVNGCISVFTIEGQFVVSFGSKGNFIGKFNGPAGLAVDNCGVVYVCDCYNNRIQCF